MIAIWVFLLCGFFGCFMLWLRARRALRKTASALDATAPLLAEAQIEIQQLRTEVERARALGDDERRRREEIFAAAKGLEKERKSSVELYITNATQHSNAQELLLREIGLLARQYEWLARSVAGAPTLEVAQKLAGRKVRRNTMVEKIVAEFSDEHRGAIEASQQSDSTGSSASAAVDP